MRLPITVLLALLALPASAQAATVGVEGTELVYRADPGTADRVTVGARSDTVSVRAVAGAVAGPGCTNDTSQLLRCPAAGVTAIRVLAGDGDDRVDVLETKLPVTADLGPGDDAAYVVEGGAQIALLGSDGDDEFGVGPASGPVDIVCGPGADDWSAGPRHRPGDGCAPSLTGITPRTVSRAFREGRLNGAASGSVTFMRRTGNRTPVARGTFVAQPGPLRVSLRPTRAGRRALARTPRLPVYVSVRTRSGEDRGETFFASRIG